jgi:hypothetical protein
MCQYRPLVRAWIHHRNGQPVTESAYSAGRALVDAGWEVRAFEALAKVEVRRDEPVIGGVPVVEDALQRLGVDPPDVEYPNALRPALIDPNVRSTTMGWVRQHPEAWPLFVKPTSGRKEFGGTVIRSTTDLLPLTAIDDGLPVYVSRAAEMLGRVEWRAFIIDGRVRDVRPYRGRPDLRAPSLLWLQLLVDQWSSIPAGCTIDVVDLGTAEQPDWRVIECNDGYAIAGYGLARRDLAELLVRRWSELVALPSLWD